MWLPVVTITPPAAEPITLAEAKAHLREDSDDNDGVIEGLISAARNHVEAYTSTRLTEQTVSLAASSWADLESFPIGPVLSVDLVQYVDRAGVLQDWAADSWREVRRGLTAQVVPAFGVSWPTADFQSDAIRVEATVGYVALPQAVRAAMLMLIAQWYDNRAAVVVGTISSELPNTVVALLSNHRMF